MTCDEFFEALTSTGELSAESATHLEACPRCRDLQEALFPAISLLTDDAMSGTSQSSYRPHHSWSECSTNTTARQVAVDSARQLSTASRVRSDVPPSILLRYTAAFFTGVAVALFIAMSLPTHSAFSASAVPSQSLVCSYQQPSGQHTGKQDADAVILSCLECHFEDSKFSTL